MQVHGHTDLSTIAIQVPLESSSLNTNDCFVLVTKSEVWLWIGKRATEEEQNVAKSIIDEIDPNSNRNCTTVLEGKESEQFWSLLGGKGTYKDETNYGNIDDNYQSFIPRLFHGSNSSGSFKGIGKDTHCVAHLLIE